MIPLSGGALLVGVAAQPAAAIAGTQHWSVVAESAGSAGPPLLCSVCAAELSPGSEELCLAV